MKRLALGVMFMICITVIGFSQDEIKDNSTNILFSVGLAFENSFFNDDYLEKDYMGSLGINLNLYTFFEENNIGLFCNLAILRPTINDYESLAHTNIIPIGLGYRFKFNENLMFLIGFGPNLNMIFLEDKDNNEITGDFIFGLGMGGDIGINYRISKLLSIKTGTTVSYNFTAYREIRRNDNYQNPNNDIAKSGWVNRYSMIGIKPYFTIGFNF